MIPLRRGSIIEKVRHKVPFGGLTWEVDVFAGENEGLVIGEVELYSVGGEAMVAHAIATYALPPGGK